MTTRIPIPADVQLVVLDLDGTIYRKPRMARYMMRSQWRHLPSLIAERRWRRAQRKAIGNSKIQRFKDSNPPFSENWYRQSYLPAMVQIIGKHYTPQAWLQPLLDECKQRGIKVAILSDYEAIEDKLHALGIDPAAFDAIMATGDFGTIKPDPRLGDIIKQHINSNAALNWRHVLFIGDRKDTDGKLAHNLGAQYIQV